MKRSLAGLFCAAGIFAGLQIAAQAQKVEEGFVPLFNGKDLSGWKGEEKLWKVEKGEIVGSTEGLTLPHNSFLMTEAEYADFVLRMKVKLRNHNSGIQIRSEELPEYAMKGYQADLAEKTFFGMLYEEQGRGFMDYWKKMSPEDQAKIHATGKQGDWNEFELRCEGDRLVITLNGKVTCDIRDPQGAKKGRIGLQLHAGPAMEVRFKDVSIMELATKTAAAAPDDGLRAGPRGSRFRVTEGFTIEQVAGEDLTGSAINMTFDHAGRPLLGVEGAGVRTLVDGNGDGKYDSFVELSPQVQNVQGLYEIEKGVYLIQGAGPDDKTGVFRATDTDGDMKAETVELVLQSDRGMGEHGPHAIRMGADGDLYIMYGNHSYPANKPDLKTSPLGQTNEDDFLPRYWDPRGHAVDIYAPGGTIHRFDTKFTKVEQFVGGFRNAYDFDLDASGEFFTYDSDMEWDVGLPWYRPCRIPHLISGLDYGWRSGSSNKPFYYFESVPSVDDTGRGSPVGVAIYDHSAYPAHYRGALFLGDWSRGRIRVLFPQAVGATFSGKAQDFLIGEPLNVTDLDVGPDGCLYFTTGGRRTHGGLYRAKYVGEAPVAAASASAIDAALIQAMPRSAWGKERLRELQASMGAEWGKALAAAASDTSRPGNQRARAIELMQVLGPKPTVAQLGRLATDADGDVRAAAVYQLGTHKLSEVRTRLELALADVNPVVARRACEALVRAGLTPETTGGKEGAALFKLLDHPDQFVRTAARLAIVRTAADSWVPQVLKDDLTKRSRGALEGLLALVESPNFAAHRGDAFAKLVGYAKTASDPDQLLNTLRLSQIALMRSGGLDGSPADAVASLRTAFLPKFPHADWRVNRELQVTLCGLQTGDAIGPILAYLEKTEDREEQIHSVYGLRAVLTGWTKPDRDRLVAWFDKGWELEGGVSLDGYINNLWEATLEFLPEEEKTAANTHREVFMAARREKALALMAALDKEKEGQVSDLAQRDFLEIAEYLEYDPMAYRAPNLEAGQRVFMRSRCADCHLFGSMGKGGGPDLTTASSRFTRRDMLDAIMYPSKVISDQYTAVDVELKDGNFYTGMVMGENNRNLTLLTASGERVDLKKKDIAKRDPSAASVMPEGLLETMNFGDLVNLIQFLEEGNKSTD